MNMFQLNIDPVLDNVHTGVFNIRIVIAKNEVGHCDYTKFIKAVNAENMNMKILILKNGNLEIKIRMVAGFSRAVDIASLLEWKREQKDAK